MPGTGRMSQKIFLSGRPDKNVQITILMLNWGLCLTVTIVGRIFISFVASFIVNYYQQSVYLNMYL